MRYDMTRRDFIGKTLAALGFTALPGGFLFAAPSGWKHGGAPNLVFGVVSDTHLRTSVKGNGLGANWPDKYFVAALSHFKSCKVDAVVHCGDMAHRGQTRELEFHAEAWRCVFKTGPEPIKLFVTGNHDVDGAKYGDFVKNRYPDEVERAKHILATDMAANWERIWGDKYEPVWHKEVKGYHFFGQNYAVPDDEAIAFLKKCGGDFALDRGDRPFFFMRHCRPSAGVRKQGLMPLRNAIAFFGHNHWSVANWNMAYLYYGRLPLIECASCEPRGCRALVGDEWITKAKIEGREGAGAGRQGYVVCLYDDMMVIKRHDFTYGESSLGSDWVMPFQKLKGGNVEKLKGETSQAHPFSKEELKKVIGEPQFRKGAKLEVVKCCQCENVAKSNVANVQSACAEATADKLEIGTGNGNNSTMATLKDSASPRLRVRIPLADGNPDSRVYAYEVVVVGEAVDDPIAPQTDGTGGMGSCRPTKLLKAVYAAGCNMGIGHEPNKGVTTLEIPYSELPVPHSSFPVPHSLTIAARPLTSLGTSGRSIATTLKA